MKQSISPASGDMGAFNGSILIDAQRLRLPRMGGTWSCTRCSAPHAPVNSWVARLKTSGGAVLTTVVCAVCVEELGEG